MSQSIPEVYIQSQIKGTNSLTNDEADIYLQSIPEANTYHRQKLGKIHPYKQTLNQIQTSTQMLVQIHIYRQMLGHIHTHRQMLGQIHTHRQMLG